MRNAKGQLALNASYVGLWGAINYVTQAVAQFGSPFTANKFGIRFNMWLFTLFKLLVGPGGQSARMRSHRSDHHHRDLLQELVALPDRKSDQRSRCRFDRHVHPVVCVRGRHASDAWDRPVRLRLLLFARPARLCRRPGRHQQGKWCTSLCLTWLTNQTDPYGFRKAFFSQFVFLGLWLPILLLLPESPVWLHKRGNVDKAKRARRRLIGNVAGYDFEHEYAVFAQGLESSTAAAAQTSRYSMLACLKGTNLRRTLVSTLPICCQVGPLL